MAFINHNVEIDMVVVFGILGNLVSFLVYLAPLATFIRIYKNKSTEKFQSIPYAVALFSAMLTLYYGFLKPDGFLLVTINSIGILIESAYILVFLIYAPREAKIYTARLLVLFNGLVFGSIIFLTSMFSQGRTRITIVGWICAVFSVCVFVAPLSIMRLVIKTKSVEYMPLSLSFSLTICAVMWLFYGVLANDYFIATPNVLGFTFGIVQMVLYFIYKNKSKGAILPIARIDLEMQKEVDDTKSNEPNSKAADEEAVVTSDQDGKETVQCNTILAVEY